MTQVESHFAALFSSPEVEMIRSGGRILLRSRHALQSYARCTGEFLQHWARVAPDRLFLVERASAGEWRGLRYGQALEDVQRVGAWLIEHGTSPQRPVAILSENSIEHGVLMLACLHIGMPVAPISPAYSLMSRDFAKLKVIIRSLSPSVLYVNRVSRFEAALEAVRDLHDGIVVVGGADSSAAGTVAFELLKRSRDTGAVSRAFAAVTPDTVAKLMFTSGSTGEPKGVINTQRMLCSNQQAIAQIWPFLEEPPVLVDWLPWHHTFGGNHNFNIVLGNGGTLYIDDGRPLPGQFEATLANLSDVAPTVCLNVPRAYDMLVTALKNDARLRDHFFSRMRLLLYAGAALPQHLWDGLRALGKQSLGYEPVLSSSWGLTETAPAVTTCHFPPKQAGVIGLPIPGCELKLLPNGDKLEVRVRGPNVTPGYFNQPDLSRALFDEEGFARTGDAVRFVDVEHPEQGLLFDGRVAEDFKLSTATWVNVGALRLAAIGALTPVAQDVVVAGADRDEVGLLIFPNLEACRLLAGLPPDASPEQVLEHEAVRARVGAGLAALRRAGQGSSTCASRALLLLHPPSIDAGEITDKGYINQRAVLTRRAALVTLLYDDRDRTVIRLFSQAGSFTESDSLTQGDRHGA
jgi:feruloyl-CoA synthase